MKNILRLAAIATIAVAGVATAGAQYDQLQTFSGSSLQFYPWTRGGCKLQIDEATHKPSYAAGGPIKFAVKNLSGKTLNYRLTVSYLISNAIVGAFQVSAGDVKPDATTHLETPSVRTILKNYKLSIRVTECTEK